MREVVKGPSFTVILNLSGSKLGSRNEGAETKPTLRTGEYSESSVSVLWNWTSDQSQHILTKEFIT